MPPVTPSPHRFLPGKRRQPSPQKTSKARLLPPPTPQPYHAAAVAGDVTPQRPTSGPQRFAQSERDATPQRLSIGHQQFATAPRFAFGRSASQSISRAEPNLAHALRRTKKPVEDVEETHPADEDDEEMLDAGPDVDETEVRPTTESTQEWVHELPYSPKRRKINDIFDSPARPAFKHPTTPASHNTPAFVRGGSVASSVATNDTLLRRPAFIRPSLPPQEHFEPLPEAFSPHRRGEKFLPGGMAATLQQWVVETGHAAAQSRRGQGYLGGEDYVFRLEIKSMVGAGPILAKGEGWDGEEVRLMLITNQKTPTADVLPGRVVGVRAPTWEVEMEEKSWIVGVDWKLIASTV